MYKSDLKAHMSKFPQFEKCFLDVYALDEVKKSMFRSKTFAVVNIQPKGTLLLYCIYIKRDTFLFSGQEGSHWFTVCGPVFTDGHSYRIIDSLGTNLDFVLKNFPWMEKCSFNSVPLQPRDSVICGLYSLYTGIQSVANDDISLQTLLNSVFSDNLEKNEETVLSFFDLTD